MNIIIKKNTGTNRVIETPVESFESYDVAVLNCAVLNENNIEKDVSYHLCDIKHNDSETVECLREGEEVYLIDDYDNRIDVNVEFEVEVVELPFHPEVTPDTFQKWSVENIEVCGTKIDFLSFSEELDKDIRHEADNVAEMMTDNEDDV